MTTLRRLILSNNNISGLSPAIGNLVNLEYLDISLNPLIVRNGHDDYSCLPKELRYLKNLLTLNLRECRLQHIPVVVWSMVSLETLDLSRNKVGFIMSELGRLNFSSEKETKNGAEILLKNSFVFVIVFRKSSSTSAFTFVSHESRHSPS